MFRLTCRPLTVTLLLAASALLGAGGAQAASSGSGTLQVSATILVSCKVSGTVLDFGSHLKPSSTSAPVDASASLSVTCTNTTPYTMALSGGSGAAGGRAMKSGSNSLPYQLYLDAARSKVWGDGASGNVYNGTGTGNHQEVAIYGRLPSLSQVAPGAYSDTVTVTISY